MNKVFKTFFSKKLNRIVIASERSKAVGKSSSKTNTVIFTALLFQAPLALAYSNGIETGVSNIAIGESALTTGKSSIALGTGAIAIGSNLSLEQLNELLNQQKSLVSDINSIRTDISSKESSYSALLDTVYKVERNLNIIKDLDQSLSSEQSKTNDLSSAWNITNLELKEKSNVVSEKLKILNSIDLSKITPTWQEDGGLDGLANQLMTSVENGTNISFGLDFYKDYITKYINVEKNINYDANRYDAVAGNPIDAYYGGIVDNGFNSNEKVIRFNTPLKSVDMQFYMTIDANAYYSESAFDFIVTKQNQHLLDFQNNFDNKIENLKQSDEILSSLLTDEYVTKLKTDIQNQFDTNARTIRKLELDKILRNQSETDPTFATLFKERQDLITQGVGSTTLNKITKDYSDLLISYKNDRLTSIQQENALNVNKIKDALNSELSDVKSRMDSIDLKLKNNKALIADYEKEIANRQPTPEELEAYNKAKLVEAELEAEKKKLSEREQALKDVQGDLADGQNATAMGTDAIATGQNSQAFGTRASALGQDTIAFGTDAKAQKAGSIAIGANSEANAQENDVAIGKGSKTALVVQTPKSIIDGKEYSFAGSAPASTFSIGSLGNERTLTNLAAGQVNGSSTDAVNGSQLFSVITALESNSSLDQLNLKYSDLDKNHVNLAGSDGTTLSNLNDGEISLNSKDAINGGQLFNVNDKLETNINIVSGIQTDITNIQNSDLKSVKYNTDNSAIILTGLNGTKISNLDDGVSDTDAVNLRQLNNVDQKVEGFNSNLTTQITNTNTLIGTTKDQLNTQIIDTNTRIDTTKDQLNTQIIDTNTLIGTTKDQLNTQIFNTNTLIGTTKDQLNTQITDTNTRIDTTKDQLAAQIDTTKNELVNTGLNFVSNTGQVVNRKLGQQLSIVGGADVDESLSSAENVITRSTDNGIKIELLKDVKFDTANIGGNILNQQGLFIAKGPSITVDGVNAGSKKITNVANGEAPTDAVNVSQLNNVDQKVEGFNSNLTTQITNTNTLIGTTKDQLNTQITDTNTLIGTTKDQLNTQIINTNTLIGTTKDQLNTQITDTNTRIDTTKDQLAVQIDTTKNELVNTGLNFVSNTGQVVNRKLGQQLSIVGGADVDESLSSAENVITRSTDNGIKIELLKDVKFDTANIGGNILNQQGLFIAKGPSITVDGINAGSKKITNVANGEASTDAVNKGQLDDLITNQNTIDVSAVKYDSSTKDSINLQGKNGTTISNLKDGVSDTDAVNLRQLNNVDQKVEGFNSNLTTQITNTNTLIGTTKDQLNTQIIDTNTRIDTTKDQLNTQIIDTNTLIGTTKDQLNTQIFNTNTLIGTTKDQLNTQITDTNTRIDTTKDQLAAQIDTTKNELVNTGLNFVSNTGQVVNRKLGQQLSIVGGADVDESLSSAENVITRSTDNGIKIELLKDVKFDTANIGGNILNQQGLFIAKGPSITVDGVNAGSKKITNVANGEASTDAVNKGQLDDLVANQNALDGSNVKYDSSTKDSINLQGKNGTTISNLKDGVSDTDAVNLRQLNNVDQKVEDFNSNLTTQITNTNTLIDTTKNEW
ncbi:hypothetical protein AMD27_16180 (plasmid) [Acinetobacter sp. TGL-Y2]|uniref:ESPR-type extended signal peptide-containing protein n=1 Tax=Acinetobacter sp. TGL-Y2 TaxID=1407071 RepID=UPI0007A67834|nr:ESPR-type extended signal peptide-containing protein [Acinetobacter sp. TGL-Y2]AMW80779.1 hypothetical protein AMD27_16180 [Acinetobacter sp. TGL-Y2]